MKKVSIKGALIAMTAAGLFAGCAEKGATAPAAAAQGNPGDIVQCHGINSCKGQGACAGADNACASQNSCKGKAWLEVSRQDCEAQNGRVGKVLKQG